MGFLTRASDSGVLFANIMCLMESRPNRQQLNISDKQSPQDSPRGKKKIHNVVSGSMAAEETD